MSEANISASADSVDAKAETKFEVMYREHREAKLEARRLQGELAKCQVYMAERDGDLDDHTLYANAEHGRAVAAADDTLRDDLESARSRHSASGRKLKAAEESHAKAVKRVESKQEALREAFNAEMRNQ